MTFFVYNVKILFVRCNADFVIHPGACKIYLRVFFFEFLIFTASFMFFSRFFLSSSARKQKARKNGDFSQNLLKKVLTLCSYYVIL